MKILFKILKGLGIFLLLIIIISFFLPSTIHLQCSQVMKASPGIVYNQVNTLKNWTKWSPWHYIDTAVQLTYDGPSAGAGARYSWKSNNPQVDEGSLSILRNIPNDSIYCKMESKGKGFSCQSYKFSKVDSGVKVTWTMYSRIEDMPWYMHISAKYFSLFMDRMFRPDLEKGLDNLKKITEKISAEEYSRTHFEVNVETTKAQIIAAHRTFTSAKKMGGDITVSYTKIGEFAIMKKLKQAGPLLIIFHNYSTEKNEMECAAPIDRFVKGNKEINVREMKSVIAATVNYHGGYDKIAFAHNSIKKWVKDNNKTISGDPWEVYIVSPMTEKDTAKWLTQIYYPIE